ncbi:hypothetical protein [Arthrobacter oryzae]|uniref:Amine oxidase n=1 Tax=Arthrobacter oryzae TaxID=409290 RepID=A0A3N0CKB9_9MICC|nr:hypothetical protein [Arthrobacter oryzae]RNL63894.1 hypothetical protein D7003_00520 [Arthrobacter oryzae]
MPNTKTGHISWGSWEFDYNVVGFEGLSLLNGTYRGRNVIGKFSMPAIRVKYRVDGGYLDWRRPLSKGAGPYADRLRWKLGGLYGLQQIANRGWQYVGLEDYIRDGVQWMEISIYGRIGAYHLSQQWHISEDGWVLPRLWSKGLTINMDHQHHPYWRLDFDIDGTDHNRVFKRNFGKWSSYTTEVNDNKHFDPRAETAWFVRNEVTLQGAWIFPGPKDGTVDNFSRIDVGIRRFNAEEELHPWRYEKAPWPHDTWNWQFDTGGLLQDNGESVNDTDVVFWYVSHMVHHANEGNDHWGSSGPFIKFALDVPPRLPPPRFGIDIDVLRNQTGNDTKVRGWGFTPGGTVIVTLAGVPKRGQIRNYVSADSSGKFVMQRQFAHTSRNPDDAFGTVDVYGFDVTTGLMAHDFVTSAYWVG